MVSCQGVLSGLVYRIGISGIGCLSPCDNGCFKTEVLMEGDNWPVFVTQTIDELMQLDGMNKEAKIYIPSTKQYMKYDDYKNPVV
jgi:hypothetical protein